MSEPVGVLRSLLLAAVPGVRHAFFTRQGGVSDGVYASLNLGRGSGDSAERVLENRRRAVAVFGVGPERLINAYQVHSPDVVVADGPWAGPAPEVDGVVTTAEGLAVGALAADCAPVLIVEPEARIVAAVHAGWRGALAGVVERGVEAMRTLGADPARMSAAVGPCIGPKSYEVGIEFLERFMREAPGSERFFAAGRGADKRQFDLPGFVLDRLATAGVARAEWIGLDTYEDEERFFSNRRGVHRGEADYGRLMSAIMLERGT
jgi:polyphenol oxidase